MATEEEKSNAWAAVQYILNRLKEPSSWAGIALFVGFFGLSNDTVARMVTNGPAVITAIAALVAIFAPSAGRKALALAKDAHATAASAEVKADVAVEQSLATSVNTTDELLGLAPTAASKPVDPQP